MMRRLLASFLLIVTTAAGAAAQPAVFVIRHAERADAGTAAAKVAGADPELSPAGKARATSLAGLLRDAKIGAIFVTEYKRTRHTAEPLSRALGVTVTEVSSKDTAGLLARLNAANGNVLVVGHSNSVPEILKGLGISEAVTVTEEDFDNLFIVTRGPEPALLRLHYK